MVCRVPLLSFLARRRMQPCISIALQKESCWPCGEVSADPTTGVHLFEFLLCEVGKLFGSSQRLHARNPNASPDSSIGKKMTSVAIYLHKLTFSLVLHVVTWPTPIQPHRPLQLLGIRRSLFFGAGYIVSSYQLAKVLDNFLRTPRMGQTNLRHLKRTRVRAA